MIEVKDLRERLCDLGIETDENEEDVLSRAIQRAEQTVLNYCNCENIPDELFFAVLDLAAGEYLGAEGDREDNDRAVKSITEGDLSVDFGDDVKDGLIDRLFCSGREEMLSFRRLKW